MMRLSRDEESNEIANPHLRVIKCLVHSIEEEGVLAPF
jgi:hypothetical protein